MNVCENCGKPVARFESNAVVWTHLVGGWVHVETRLFACYGVNRPEMASVASDATLVLSDREEN